MKILRPLLCLFCFMSLNGCTGLLIYELINANSVIQDGPTENVPIKINHYKLKKHDKSNMYPPPKSEFKLKKRSNNHAN